MYQGETDARISTNNTCTDGNGQTDRHIHKHPRGDQLVHNCDSMCVCLNFLKLPLITPVLCMQGRLLLEETFPTTPVCPCPLFALFCSSVPLHVLSLYIVSLHILSIISHVQHWVHSFGIWNIRWDAFSRHCFDLWWFKKPLCRLSEWWM